MNKLQTFMKGAERCLPDILVGTGVALNVTAVVSGILHTPKAMNIIMDEEAKKGEKLTKTETIKAVWKVYLPTAIELVAGEACIIGGTICYHKRNASLLALCSLSESTLSLYKDKLVEELGQDKANEIEDKVTEEKLKKTIETNNKTEVKKLVAFDPNGKVPCYDEWSGRIFMSRESDIERAVNRCNKELLDCDECSLNTFYYEMGLGGIEMGEDYGWSLFERRDKLIEVVYATKPIDGIPYLTIRFARHPKPLRTMY